MERTDQLYDWYVQEIPVNERKGVERLLDHKHYGLAEKHAVYALRSKLSRGGRIRVNEGVKSYLV